VTGEEALEKLKWLIEYITRIDYVEPELRLEVKQELIKAYKDSNGLISTIQQALERLEVIDKMQSIVYMCRRSKDVEARLIKLANAMNVEIRIVGSEDSKKLELILEYLIKWEEQLAVDGVNSKSMVRNDIGYLLKEVLGE